MRILHLIDAASSQATSTTLALAAESADQIEQIDQRFILLGSSKLAHEAASVDLQPAATISVPLGHAILGWSSVRQYARQNGPFDLIHCWSVETLSLATLLFRTVPRVLTLTIAPSCRTARWIATLLRESSGQTVVLPISGTIKQSVLQGGVPEQKAHVLRPGINMSRMQSLNKTALRSNWHASNNNVKIIVLLGDTLQAVNTELISTAMILSASSSATDGMKLRLLVHPDQSNRLRIQQLFHHIPLPLEVIQEPRISQPWSILPGCDLSLAIGPHGGSLSLLWSMAANVPIIGEATYATSEFVEGNHSALLAQPNSAKHIALRISQLLGDPQLAWKLRDTARHEAYSYFSCQHYRHCLSSVYRQITEGRDVEIPTQEASGGLRFAGQA